MTGKVFKDAAARSPICLFSGLQRFGKDHAFFEASAALDFTKLGDLVLEFDDGSRWNFAVERHDARTNVHGRIWGGPRA
ncbi:MAG: hypothetical protein U0183_10675 [Polyangiaceae bacterium]